MFARISRIRRLGLRGREARRFQPLQALFKGLLITLPLKMQLHAQILARATLPPAHHGARNSAADSASQRTDDEASCSRARRIRRLIGGCRSDQRNSRNGTTTSQCSIASRAT